MATGKLLLFAAAVLALPVQAQSPWQVPAVTPSAALDRAPGDSAASVIDLTPLDSSQVSPTPPIPQEFCCSHKHFGATLLELGILEVVPWYFNRHVGDDSTAVLTFDAWKRNVEEGFEWDPNNFNTNMFMHPYHGNVYFNAARSNGYNFWESAAVAWFGSFIWEFFGENNRAAVNDWVNTSLGGIVMGEALNRASWALLDNTATGTNRTLRELAAFFVNPLGGANRLFRGEMTRVGPNPTEHYRYPDVLTLSGRGGLRWVGDGNRDNGETSVFLEFNLGYGNAFALTDHAFDRFLLTLQLNSRKSRIIGRLSVEGRLFDTWLSVSEKERHLFGISQHYDYIDTEAYEVGGQSVSATFLSQYRFGEKISLITKIQPTAAVISAISSEFAESTGRNYDFGSGAGVRTFASLWHGRKELASLMYVVVWAHSLNGAAGDHFVHFTSFKGQIPSRGWRPGIGAEFLYAARNSLYRDFPDVHRRNPQARIYLTIF